MADNSHDLPAGVRELEVKLEAASAPRERLPLLVQLGKALWLSSPERARRYLEEVLTLAPESGDDESLAPAANMLAELARRAGDAERCSEHATAALEAARRAGVRRTEAAVYNVLGALATDLGQFAQAREHLEHCAALSRDCEYPEGEQAALNQLGNLFGLQGDVDAALVCYQKCLAVDQRLGDNYGRALDNHNIGWAFQQQGNWEAAAEHHYRALALCEQYGYQHLHYDVMLMLGELYLKRNRLPEAVGMFAAVAESRGQDDAHLSAVQEALCNLGVANRILGNLAAAERYFSEDSELVERTGDPQHRAVLALSMAELALEQGQLERMAALLAEADRLASELGLKPQAAEVLRLRARMFAAQGVTVGARDSYEQAIALLSDMGDSYELARARLQFGRFLVAQGGAEEAVGLVRAAAQTFGRLAVVAEYEESNRLLLRLESPADRGSALLGALKGLVGIGLEPVTLLERVLDACCETLGFESGCVVATAGPTVMLGAASPARARELIALGEMRTTPTSLALPLVGRMQERGVLYLERSSPAGSVSVPGVDEIRSLLAPVVTKLSAIPFRGEHELEIPGLQYRGVIGRNPRMLENLRIVARVASASIPVLIRGESGTGKELVARSLHESGSRRDAPFVAVNCAAVPESLLESEFFGIEKGAATGVVARKGKFEQAAGGTVFLDEIGDMAPALQAKLLRIIQEKRFERVGGSRTIDADVRIIAATNQDIRTLMADGSFREDLYYRLNAIEIELPPLRERREDIPGFVRYFITRSNQEYTRDVLGASSALMSAILVYDWPGNIRQLHHLVERAVLLATGQVLELADMPPEFCSHVPEVAPAPELLRSARRQARQKAGDDVECALVQDCLERAKWNVKEAAQLSGYSRAQFYRLMSRHGITRPEK